MGFNKPLQNEKGQSLLEVIFVLPFLFMFVGILFKLNLSISQAIVNTQYSRSQIYSLTANSPEYPRLQFTQYSGGASFANQSQDMMVLGVADPSAFADKSATNPMPAYPQLQGIARNKSVVGSSDVGEQTKRSQIRIRNSSAICTQLNVVPTGTSQRWPYNGKAVCQYKGMTGS